MKSLTINSRKQSHSSLRVMGDKPSVCGTLFFMEHWKNKSLENLVEEIDGIVYTEEWKPIAGFEGLYEVSSFGRVRNRKIILYQRPNNARGYLQVGLHKKGKEKKPLVHRLVGIAYIPNPLNLPQINHKFGNVTDNRVVHLEWMNNSQNHKHAYEHLNRTPFNKGMCGKLSAKSRPVVQYDRKGKFIAAFESSTQAANVLKKNHSGISAAARGDQHSAYGFLWRYTTEIKNVKPWKTKYKTPK